MNIQELKKLDLAAEQMSIIYWYLNMDTMTLVESQTDLVIQIGVGGTLRSVGRHQYNECFIAGSRRYFTEVEMSIAFAKLNEQKAGAA